VASWAASGLGKIESFDLGGVFIATVGAIVLLVIYQFDPQGILIFKKQEPSFWARKRLFDNKAKA
jgi:hypothetical protein